MKCRNITQLQNNNENCALKANLMLVQMDFNRGTEKVKPSKIDHKEVIETCLRKEVKKEEVMDLRKMTELEAVEQNTGQVKKNDTSRPSPLSPKPSLHRSRKNTEEKMSGCSLLPN